ncbi:hypothetical protein [Streptomyces sp. ISID311]|uniref:hypothetical protein n=1 Tax=Streptomyces sp. ISID311 TaxID=2601673 RepID=UPI0011BD2F01|nr:hypothetical protein [Streptomyces sp. ISID311]TXC98900.1 hypothetical protein FS847_05800 [Streptomyces sp. ISID311]
MLLAIAQETAAATAATPAPWWGTALGAGIGALGAGLVSSVVALINNHANRGQLDKQLSAQKEMLATQLDAQREQVSEQLRAQQQQSVDTLTAQLQQAQMNIEANCLRDKEEQLAELRKWRLETRRDTYTELVVAVEKLRDTVGSLGSILSGVWPLPAPLSEEQLDELKGIELRVRGEYESAFQRAQVVRLTGPDSVSRLAEKLGVTMTMYLNFSEERCRSARLNLRSDTIRDWQKSATDMHTLLESFISAAYQEVSVNELSPSLLPRQASDAATSVR